MSRRRVLWLSHFVPYPATGHGALQRSHHLLREVALRHDVVLLSVAPPTVAAAGLDLQEAREALARMVEDVELFPLPRDPVKLRRAWILGTGVFTREPFWLRWWAHRGLWRRVQAVLQDQRIDVVLLDSILLARLLVLARDVPCVVNHHNVESDVVAQRAKRARGPLLRFLLEHEARKVRLLERDVSVGAARNLAVSALDGDRLRAIAPGAKIETIPNGVDTEYFRVRSPEHASPTTMVFAGGMDWFPNRDAMLHFVEDIWPRLKAGNHERRMVIIGRQPPPQLLSTRDAALSVLGFVDDVRPHLERAAIYICPMRLGGGTRLKILDALAMSRALVSTDLGVEGLGLIPEVHYLAANTPEEYCRQVARLERDADLRARLGASGRAYVEEHYSWRLVGERLARLLNEIAQEAA